MLQGHRERVRSPGQVRSVEAKVPNHTKTALCSAAGSGGRLLRLLSLDFAGGE